MIPAKQEFLEPSVFNITNVDIFIFDVSHCQGATDESGGPQKLNLLSAEPKIRGRP